MKKIISLMTIIIIMIGFSTTSFAQGDPNINTGGGGMGDGNANNFWNPGMDGVRVSVFNENDTEYALAVFDYTNRNPLVDYHFGKINKIEYKHNSFVDITTNPYYYTNLERALPTIISDNGRSDVEAIRLYFRKEGTAKMIAREMGIIDSQDNNIPNGYGITWEEFIDGSYSLLLEPIAYFTFQGSRYAMTATEAAIYNRDNGGLHARMASLTRQNLPLAMFLERQNTIFSISEPPGRINLSAMQTDNDIIRYLGVGIVTYGAAFAPTGEINWGGGSMKEDYREDRENSRRRIYSPKPVRAVFASDLRYKHITDDEYYPFRSGYYFNPTGTYTTTVQTVVNATSPNPTREHANLVNAAVGAFRYESDMVYLHPDTRQAVTIDAATVSKNGTSYKATKRSVSPNFPPTNQRLFNITDARQHTLTYEIIDEESPEGEADTHNYIVTETTQITITVNPENTKVYTHAHMADGNYSVRAYIDPTGITTTVQLTTPLDRIIELDAISIMIVGSMYDDIR